VLNTSEAKFSFAGKYIDKECRLHEVEAYESVFNPDYYFKTILDGSLDTKLKETTRKPWHDTQLRYKEYFAGMRPFVVGYYGHR
jgi:hypothetical protein